MPDSKGDDDYEESAAFVPMGELDCLGISEAELEFVRFVEGRYVIMFRIGVFGIVTDEEDRVLLCHRRDYDLWNLPGGGVGPGESPWDALVREIGGGDGSGSGARPSLRGLQQTGK